MKIRRTDNYWTWKGLRLECSEKNSHGSLFPKLAILRKKMSFLTGILNLKHGENESVDVTRHVLGVKD